MTHPFKNYHHFDYRDDYTVADSWTEAVMTFERLYGKIDHNEVKEFYMKDYRKKYDVDNLP